MKNLFSILFSTLMLGVILTNSILEIGMANKAISMELSEEGKAKNETESDENETKENEEKKPQTDEKDLFYKYANLIIVKFDATAELKAGLTQLYVDNLCQYSRTLETPPPEVVCS